MRRWVDVWWSARVRGGGRGKAVFRGLAPSACCCGQGADRQFGHVVEGHVGACSPSRLPGVRGGAGPGEIRLGERAVEWVRPSAGSLAYGRRGGGERGGRSRVAGGGVDEGERLEGLGQIPLTALLVRRLLDGVEQFDGLTQLIAKQPAHREMAGRAGVVCVVTEVLVPAASLPEEFVGAFEVAGMHGGGTQ